MKIYKTLFTFLALFVSVQVAEAQISLDGTEISKCVDLRYNLTLRSTDTRTKKEISLLQNYLSPNHFKQKSTGYFGSTTVRAVKAFQRDNGIRVTGYVGSATRAKIKQLTCCGAETGVSSSSPANLYFGLQCIDMKMIFT